MASFLAEPPVDRQRITAHLLDATDWRQVHFFRPEEYSRFKYGCGATARKFGEDLAEVFIRSEFFQNYTGNGDDLVVTSSPYKYIHSASTAIMDYFLNRLNMHLAVQGKDAASDVKINRKVLFEGDYGKLSEEERYAQAKRDRMTVDTHFVEGKTLLVIDDVKITGSHEEKVANMLIENGVKPSNILYLYYAELLNPDKTGANYEDYLNHYYVKTLDDLRGIIAQPNFHLNARVCKFILSHQNREEVIEFAQHVSLDFLYRFLAAIHGDGYHNMALYRSLYLVISGIYARRSNCLAVNYEKGIIL